MLTNQLIDQQRVATARALQDHNDALRGLCLRPVHFEHFPQLNQRQVFAAHFEDALAARQRMQIFFTRLQGFHDGVQRQDKDFVRHFN